MRITSLLLSLLIFSGSSLFAEEIGVSVGNIIAMQGHVSAQGRDGLTRDLGLKSFVFSGDKIVTDGDSLAHIMFNDDTILSQGVGSEIIITSYRYTSTESPECMLFMQNGSFRIVTGKISDISPDQFVVNTSLSRIELHGCAVGFNVDASHNKIHVINLPKGDEVIIQKINQNEGRDNGHAQIRKHGVTVDIDDRNGFKERRTENGEIEQLIEKTCPKGKSKEAADHQNMPGKAKGLEQGKGEGHEKGNGQGHEFEYGRGHQRDDDIDSTYDPPPFPEDPPPPPDLPGVSGDNDQGDDDQGNNDQGNDDDDQATDDQGDDDQGDDSNVDDQPDQAVYVTGGSGEHWEWGRWELNGNVEDLEVSSDDVISSSQFQLLADGSTRYDLSGSGDSAALILHDGSKSYVEGACDLNVSVGDAVLPSWDGVFDMNNMAGDSLSFEADGTIKRDGSLDGNQVSYSLQVDGVPFGRGTISDESISGNLVGPGTGIDPITGAIGEFRFEHGSDASVSGVFATDLN